jgi:hypothetical protein
MQNEQINLTPLEMATICNELTDLAADKKISITEKVRVCADKENVISIYGADALLFTIDRVPND